VNAKMMGGWLVWQEERKHCSLDISNIETVCFFSPCAETLAPSGDNGATALITVNGLTSILKGEDAIFFHEYWQKYLADAAEDAATWREDERKWRERHAGPEGGA